MLAGFFRGAICRWACNGGAWLHGLGDDGGFVAFASPMPQLSVLSLRARSASPWGGLLLLAVLAGCTPDDALSPADRAASRHAVADLVLFNGRILTMDPRMPEASAIALREGRILALGESADIEPLTNAATRLVDLQGRVLVPGLLDARDPEAGAAPPACMDPALAGPDAALRPGDAAARGVDAAPAAAGSGLDPASAPPVAPVVDVAAQIREVVLRQQQRGVTAMRYRAVPVAALPGLLEFAHTRSLRMVVQLGHLPPCGAQERLQLQQVMRDMLAGSASAATAGLGTLRLQLDPTPAPVPVELTPVAPPGPSSDPGATNAPGPAEPAMPAVLPDPWQAMAAAMRGGAGEPGQSARKAMRAFTAGAAREFGLEREAGMLAPGLRADMAVIDRNPLESAPDAVAAVEVLQTWFDGELVHERAGWSAP